MARIRTIKPEFWQDERMAQLSRDARLLFIGLWNVADDFGRLRGHPSLIKGQVFPYDIDLGVHHVKDLLDQLESHGRIVRYQSSGQWFIWVRHFTEHQKMDKRAESKLPPPSARDMAEPADNVAEAAEDLAEQKTQTAENTPPEIVAEPAQKLALEWNRDQGKEQGTGNREQVREKADAAGSSPPVPFPSVPEKPTKDDDLWEWVDFWAWAQAMRVEEGLAPERRPKNERTVSAQFSGARMQGVSVKAMRLGFVEFANDPYWASPERKPAIPFAGFMSQIEKYLPAGATHAA